MRIDKNYLPYEYFEQIQDFVPTEVLDGVYVTKLPTNKGLYFHAKFEKGAKIIEHYHNAMEFIHIVKGEVLLNNKDKLTKGDEAIFKPFQLHNVDVLEECEMYIQFMKDESFKKLK